MNESAFEKIKEILRHTFRNKNTVFIDLCLM